MEALLDALNPAHTHLCRYIKTSKEIVFASNNPGLTSKSIVNLIGKDFPGLKAIIHKKNGF